MKIAAFDIGSNSILCNISEVENGKIINTIFDESEVCRLGDGLNKSGLLNDKAMERTYLALKRLMNICKINNANKILSAGTMALRTAKNSNEFIKRVENELKLKIKIVSGEDEAKLSYLGVISNNFARDKKICVFDVGGGSTELIFGQNENIKEFKSLNTGTIRFTEEYLSTDLNCSKNYSYCSNLIFEELSKFHSAEIPEMLISVGGTACTIGAVKLKMNEYDANKVNGTEISLKEIEEQILLYLSNSIENRKSIPGLHPKRADVILAGAMITLNVLKKLNVNSFYVSDKGLRHGLIISYLKNIK
jgi:exopolyphosphatase/guanosine-5'-triphosphate,3'-diphosphate pyrophosphatase